MLKGKISGFLKYLAAFILSVGLLENAASAQENVFIMPGEPTVITPGEGVGVLKLGEPYASIQKALGDIRPFSFALAENKVDGKELWLSYRDIGIAFAFDYETKILERIIVLTPALLVRNTGIHAGSEESEVKKYFKDTGQGGPADELAYPGIKFFIKDKRIFAIEIGNR